MLLAHHVTSCNPTSSPLTHAVLCKEYMFTLYVMFVLSCLHVLAPLPLTLARFCSGTHCTVHTYTDIVILHQSLPCHGKGILTLDWLSIAIHYTEYPSRTIMRVCAVLVGRLVVCNDIWLWALEWNEHTLCTEVAHKHTHWRRQFKASIILNVGHSPNKLERNSFELWLRKLIHFVFFL